MDFAGKTVFQADVKANSLAVDPQTGNLWCLTSNGLIRGDKTVVLNSDGGVIQDLYNRRL